MSMETQGEINLSATMLLNFLRRGGELNPELKTELQALLGVGATQEAPPQAAGAVRSGADATSATVANALNEHPDKLDAVWSKYKNPHLKEEFDRLTGEEKEKIDSLAAAIEAEARVIGMSGKKLGVESSRDRRIQDHHYYDLHNADKSSMDVLNDTLTRSTSEDLLIALTPGIKSKDTRISIQNHPTDPNSAIVVYETLSASETSLALWEGRSCHFKFALVVKKDGELLKYLRSGEDGRLFMYALRNAALKLDPSSQRYLDVPLQGGGKLGSRKNPLSILDLPKHRITRYESTQEPGEHSKVYPMDSDARFKDKCISLGISARERSKYNAVLPS